MDDRRHLLRDVMRSTGTTQSGLARVSGVHQPSISQFLSGRIDLSDEQLDRLLSCMGFRLEVVRRPVQPELTRAERRSWLLHRALASRLSRETFPHWLPTMEKNLDRLAAGVTGQPHERNVRRWTSLVGERDILGLKRALTGLDRDSVEMREVSPMSGLLSQTDRLEVLAEAS